MNNPRQTTQGSGGFSVTEQKVHHLFEALNDAYHEVKEGEYASEHEPCVDADISLEDINDTFVHLLATLSPYAQ